MGLRTKLRRNKMIKGLAITTPIVGTIRLGEVAVNAKDKRYPVRLNHFKITAQYKDSDGQWVEHPTHKAACDAAKVDTDKLTEIPVRLMFNSVDLNLRARYEAFDKTGRILCAGDGCTARRSTGKTIEQVKCIGADHCQFGIDNRCDLFARLNVQIDVPGADQDEFSSFILRTESVNAVRTLYAKMKRMHAYFGGRLVGIPFVLKLRQKASSMSHWTKFWYADLMLNKVTALQAIKLAEEYEDAMEAAGLDQKAYEQEVLAGLSQGAFEEGGEDFDELEAFLLAREGVEGDDAPPQEVQATVTSSAPQAAVGGLDTLRNLLDAAGDAGALKVTAPA